MALPISLGTSDFLQLRLDETLYVDKSLFVAEALRELSRVVLLPRPRRFGKTLNLTTLRYFVERPTERGAKETMCAAPSGASRSRRAARTSGGTSRSTR